jgi:hypothetical protein
MAELGLHAASYWSSPQGWQIKASEEPKGGYEGGRAGGCSDRYARSHRPAGRRLWVGEPVGSSLAMRPAESRSRPCLTEFSERRSSPP